MTSSAHRTDSPAGQRLADRVRQAGSRPHFDVTVCQALDQFHEQQEAAQRNALIGLADPPLRGYRRPARWLALLASRVVRTLARPLTSCQRDYNTSALASQQSLSECLYEQGATLVRLEAELARVKAQLARRDREAPAAPASSTTTPAGHVSGVPAHLDDVYVAFEEAFRGTRDEIKERQRVYLPWLTHAEAGRLARPVLDVGCGRGEWLELLQGERLAGRGLDINAAMVDECRSRGLDAQQGDLLPALAALADDSLGAITGFHIVEHLPLGVLVRLFDEALRLLKPGGLAIFETPNPNNVIVGSNSFYLDPTHRNPLPPPLLKFLAEARGFGRVEIVELHPRQCPINAKIETDWERHLRQLFYGPMDYALIGFKM